MSSRLLISSRLSMAARMLLEMGYVSDETFTGCSTGGICVFQPKVPLMLSSAANNSVSYAHLPNVVELPAFVNLPSVAWRLNYL